MTVNYSDGVVMRIADFEMRLAVHLRRIFHAENPFGNAVGVLDNSAQEEQEATFAQNMFSV
jgi:hypothetical protein